MHDCNHDNDYIEYEHVHKLRILVKTLKKSFTNIEKNNQSS